MAYERVSGEQPLALRPAWAAPTYLLTSERRQGDSSAPIIAPELSVALTLDPDGDLLVTTDLGVAAAVAPRSGALRWLARCQPGNFQQGLPAEPPLRAGGAVHYLIGGRLYQLDPETGDARWSQPVGAASRLLAGEGFLLAYGEQRAFGLDLERGQTLFGLQLQSRDRYRCVGRIVRCGERLLVPLWRRGPGGRVAVLRRDAASQAWIAAEEVALPKIEGPFNLALTPRGVVGAAARRAVFLAWREPGRDF
ncbi:MAG: PQQ-binding-like beta-propeller repeat protein [Planctomycetota bacterium]